MPQSEGYLNPYLNLLRAALTGGETEVRQALAALSEKQIARLRNVALQLVSLTEDRRGSWSL
jgi:hypothetical protein